MNIFRKLLAVLPTITVGMDDWHLHVSVGERGRGFTVGPRFLSYDKDGDIAHMLISPPEGYQAPTSDITFDWNSREGLTYLNAPAVQIKTKPFAWENTDAYTDTERDGGWTSVGVSTPQDGPFVGECEEEPEPSTIRWTRKPTYIDEQRAIAGEDVYGIHV